MLNSAEHKARTVLSEINCVSTAITHGHNPILKINQDQLQTAELLQKAKIVLHDKTLNVGQKLTKIDALMPFPATASAKDLGDVFGKTKQAVMKTSWWIENRKGEKKSEVGRRHEKHRDRAQQLESKRANNEDDER